MGEHLPAEQGRSLPPWDDRDRMRAVRAAVPRGARTRGRRNGQVQAALGASKRDRGRRHGPRTARGVISLRRSLAKPHLRVIGIDDGPFTRRHRSAVVAAVAMTMPGTIDGLLTTRVRVDGTDGTDALISFLRRSPYLPGSRAILIDGISVAGFNVVDLSRLSRSLSRPVLSVTRRAPDLGAMRSAIEKYFPKDARRRFRLVRRHRPFAAIPRVGSPWISIVGGSRQEARQLMARTTLVGQWPEPLRLAHLLARAAAEAEGHRRTARRDSKGRSVGAK
jgi:endonuclease V-like protein UPF0215 family